MNSGVECFGTGRDLDRAHFELVPRSLLVALEDRVCLAFDDDVTGTVSLDFKDGLGLWSCHLRKYI